MMLDAVLRSGGGQVLSYTGLKNATPIIKNDLHQNSHLLLRGSIKRHKALKEPYEYKVCNLGVY